MKIKQACEATDLSERTIRYYESERLIRPARKSEGGQPYRDYSEQDVEDLRAIAGLRRASFSLAEIREMMQTPERIPEILDRFAEATRREVDGKAKVLLALESVGADHRRDVATLSKRLQRATDRLDLPPSDVQPNFGRLDGITPEEREQAYQEVLRREEARGRSVRFLTGKGLTPVEARRVRRIRRIAVAVVLVLALGILVPVPFRIDRKITAFAWQDRSAGVVEDPPHEVPSLVIVKGWYFRHLIPFFTRDFFEGSLTVSNYTMATRGTLMRIEFRRPYGDGTVFYYDPYFNRIVPFGRIQIEGLFSKVVLDGLPVPTGEPESTRRLVSAPATTRQEAVDLANSLYDPVFGEFQ